MSYSITRITEMLGLSAPLYPDYEIRMLLTDSRSLADGRDTLFFALRTRNNDGHKYIPDLYSRGIRNFVVDNMDMVQGEMPGANFLLVDNVTAALQRIAACHRQRFSIPVVGITGSRGKTTVKEWLYQLMHPDYDVVRSPRSYNSQIGVPLSIWELDPETEMAFFEAGISQEGEMASLAGMMSPGIGIFTNLGPEHDEGFVSLERKGREKALLMRGCDTVIFNADDALVRKVICEVCPETRCFTWSRQDADAQVRILKTEKLVTCTEITYSYEGRTSVITIPFVSDTDIDDALHCLAFVLFVGMPVSDIERRMKSLMAVGTRLNVYEGVNNCLIIYDNYTSDVRSLVPALDFMHRRATSGRSSTVILSDIVHEHMQSGEIYKEVAIALRRYGVSRLIGIGAEISRHAALFSKNAEFYPDTAAFLSSVSPADFDSELILIKGAAQFNFRSIAGMLEARHHETVLEVNLDSVVHNFNHFRSMIKPTTGIVVMVKASGYGAGSYEIAKTLQSQGAAYLAVAVLDEGVELRRAGITMPIMVLNPKVVNYKSMFAYNLEPEIFTFEMLDEIIHEGNKRGISDYPVHIKFDTGMHRLGFLEKDIPRLIEVLSSQTVVKVKSVFSHLATADCADMDDYTKGQLTLFDRCCKALADGLRYEQPFLRHILNSAGIARFPEYQYDMVRLGICLYGVATMDIPQMQGLKTVSSLHTIIISIKHWTAGTTIGYGRRGVLKRDSVIATIPIGYADGMNRHLGNGNACVWINGHRCPTVGNICMDACMIDVTDVECQVGDAVEIFGDNIPVSELSDTLGTIPYEILTWVSTRVKRVYYRE